jgi:hypothetical protein
MGLDMYLNKRTYIGAHYEHNRIQASIDIRRDDQVIPIDPGKVISIEERVGYWRKANTIHKWFVDNCQGGEDNCQETQVSEEQLKKLLGLCKDVMAKARLVDGKVHNGTTWKNVDGKQVREEIYEDSQVIENAEEIAQLLPTQEGCFFGSTDYDMYYLEDVKSTIAILEVLDLDGKNYGISYVYQASW